MNAPATTKAAVRDRSDLFTLLALFVGLVAYPLLYSTDFFGSILFAIVPSLLPRVLDEATRFEWWYFGASNLAFHWVAFAFVALALRRNGQQWSSIGVDWQWFNRYKAWLLTLLGLLVVAAFAMPQVHYGDNLPAQSSLGFIGPVSTVERLFMIVLAATAAVTEEVIFRGFALTRLRQWVGSAWLVLPVTALSFVFIHGEFEGWFWFANYFGAGIVFGIPFILMKLRRLEIVILIHFLIDAALVLAP